MTLLPPILKSYPMPRVSHESPCATGRVETDGFGGLTAGETARFLTTERIREHRSGEAVQNGDAPEGPGRNGNKPLMRNRKGHDVPLPDRDNSPDNFKSVSKETDFHEAQVSANLCREWVRLKEVEHFSGNQAAKALGKSPGWFSINVPKFTREGIAAFLPERRELGAMRKLFCDLPAWFLPVARFYYLNTNLTSTRGSVPEAIRCTISMPQCPPSVQRRLIKVCMNNGWRPVNGEKLPECPAALREDILLRAKSGKPLLPESITKQITVAAPFVKQHRNPTDAGLNYISAAGTQMWIQNADSGEKIFIRGGDVVECDDATINFPVCIPWTIRGCACSERYEVNLGRFQWLVAIDAGSRRVLGYVYSARPKSSYRGEDVLALMRCVARQHGIPRVWRLEKGVWKSNLVENAVRAMGSARISVHSPHAKPFIEGLFNKLWTKLSVWFPEASVGRFQGENEEANRLLTACQAGHQDPRKHFPMLADVIAAFNAVIEEHNASIIRSDNYGEWVPHERWDRDTAARPLPALIPESEWIFSPFVRTWTVQGANVGGKVPLMDGVSVPYIFSAPFLLHFHGAKVRAHFDPSEPRCFATIVLAQAFGNHRAGEVLGVAQQINETTAYIRLVMGYGDDSPHSGIDARRQASSALRREVRGINGPSKVGTGGPAVPGREEVPGRLVRTDENGPSSRAAEASLPAEKSLPYSESEQRDGLGQVQRISSGSFISTGQTASQECGSGTVLNNRSLGDDSTSRSRENPGMETSAFASLRRDKPDVAKVDDLLKFEEENAHLFA